MRSRSVTTIGLIGLMALTGCAAMQERRWGACAAAGGVAGALIGGGLGAGLAAAYEQRGPNDKDDGEVVGIGLGSAAGGALAGTLLGHLICDPREEAPPPPPPAAPPPPPPPTPRKISLSADAHFDFDKATLKPGGEAEVDRVVDSMKENTKLRVLVEGHTDSIGSEAYNQRLSERRAEAVRRYMVSQGIEDSRITTKSYGESQPVADNKTKEGRAKNRRVDITTE